MPRLPRLKVEGEDGWYHLWNSAGGPQRAFPLQDEVVFDYTPASSRGVLERCGLGITKAKQ